MYTSTIKLVYWQLLLYGVHVGHSFSNSIIFSAWLTYTYRQNILIINLFKTVLMFKNGYVGLSAACHFSGPIWFINLHRSVELFVNYSAKLCGEFCYTTYWIHGLISNWLTLANTFKKLNRMVTTSHKGQFSKLELESSPLIMGRFSWPRATFISSVDTSPHPTKESLYLGIPCLGIVDTNVSGHIANIAIPGNDDALDCVVFYNTHISQYILEKKYGNISGWFTQIRKQKRMITFIDWVFNNYISKEGLLDKEVIYKEEKKKGSLLNNMKLNLKFKAPYNTIWTYGLDFFFSKNYGLTNFKEQVDLYESKDKYLIFDIDYYLLKYRKSSIYLTKIINYFILKASWRFNRFIKKKTFKNKLFKRRFLTGFYEATCYWDVTNSKNYMKSRFYVNRFYKTHLKRNKWRFNKFILKFVKLYFIKKFMEYRGFILKSSLNIMNRSSLYYISSSLGSKLFTDVLYNKILKKNNNKEYKVKNNNVLFKWHYFKENIIKQLISLLNKKFINKFFKISIKWKINKLLMSNLEKKIKLTFVYYMSFFNFFLWNRTVLLKNKTEYNRYYFKEWKILKNIQKNYIYLTFLNKAYLSYHKFKNIFKFTDCNNINNNLIYYFSTLTSDYRKSFFLNINNYKFDKLLQIPKYFKKTLKKNKKKRDKIFKKVTKKIKASLSLKNFKNNKKFKKVIYYKRRVLKSAQELNLIKNNFKYKRNKYLTGNVKTVKFLTLSNYLNILSKWDNKINKIKYFYQNKINFNELQFINISYYKFNNYNTIKDNKLNNENIKLNINFASDFFTNFCISVFRFNFLIYRYYYPYFFRWDYLKRDDNNRIKNFIIQAKVSKNKFILNNIRKNLTYMRLRIKAYNVYKKHKTTIKGVSNYLLMGNVKLRTTFINKYWIYSKINFNYPFFFYLNFVNKKFKIYKNIISNIFNQRFIIKGKKKLGYYFFFLRIFSFYFKYFFSFYKNDFYSPKLLFLKYDINKKRIYWI